jgi:hypothetical protein
MTRRPRTFDLRVSADDPHVAYLALPAHPGASPGVVKRSVRLVNVIGAYRGADVVLDFDEHDVLIGIEIIGDEES